MTENQSVPSGRPSRRSVLQLLGAGAVVPALSSLAACSSGSSGGPSNAAKGTGAAGASSGQLTLVYMGDATQQTAFNQLFAAFNKVHPEIKIKANGIAAGDWGTFANTVSTQIAGGKIPDIVDIATEGQQLFASKGLLEPLDDYIKKDKAVTDPFYAGIDPHLKEWTVKYGSPDGKTYYIPGGYNTMVMYCNNAVFAKAGVAMPNPNWTWDEFEAAAKQIKAKTGAYMCGLGYGFPFGDIMPWLLTNGASTMDADWKKATFNSPAAIESATFVRNLLAAGYSPKPGGAFDADSEFKKGKLAIIGAGRWSTLDMRNLKMVDDVTIVNWPTKTGNGSPVGWDGWPIMKASKKKDMAWTFLKWMMSKDAGEFYATIGGTNVPALTAVAESSAFTNNAPKGSTLLAKAVSYGTPIPSPAKGAQVQTAVTTAWQAALTGTSSVKAALDKANAQIQALL
ncbi:ABC transporter substrate-binding protein [Flexivirga caeni]|uniref:Sugar ABC transporter substrate-binding protein n=1 Tax=Flexivirga caeni TaxID=2294115 RepID=A0A3M9M509_9MICO|nr:sugar ABC transporter substrate-binding protein [Flexivirga caeni]RNI20297.1 sugar ABC transporter substrate-binding protein [Flexivirga caeni]